MNSRPINLKSIGTTLIFSILVVYACYTFLGLNGWYTWLIVGLLISVLLSILILSVYIWWKYITRHFYLVSSKKLENILKKNRRKHEALEKVDSDNVFNSVAQSPPSRCQRMIAPTDLKYVSDPAEKILILSSDPYLNPNSLQEIDFKHINASKLIAIFRKNRISLCTLKPLSKYIPRWFTEQIRNEIESDGQVYEFRLQTIRYIINLFNQVSADFLVIKLNHFVDWYYGTDVDILPRNLKDELNLLRALEQEGYSLYRLSVDVNPFKITARKDGFVDIDFYPYLEWFRFYVVDMKIKNIDQTFERKVRIKVDENLSVWTPSVEDDVLIMSLHDFTHRFIPYASILHGVQLVMNCDIDWGALIKSASKNGLLIPLYVYLSLINEYTSLLYHCTIIPRFVTDYLDSLRICKLTGKILEYRNAALSLPFKIPLLIVILDLLLRIFKRKQS